MIIKFARALPFFFIISLLVFIGQQTQKIITNPDIAYSTRLLDAWLQTQIRYGKMPGVSEGIVYNGELIYYKVLEMLIPKKNTLHLGYQIPDCLSNQNIYGYWDNDSEG